MLTYESHFKRGILVFQLNKRQLEQCFLNYLVTRAPKAVDLTR